MTIEIIALVICAVLGIGFLGIHIWRVQVRNKTLNTQHNTKIFSILKNNIWLMFAIFLGFVTIALAISLI